MLRWNTIFFQAVIRVLLVSQEVNVKLPTITLENIEAFLFDLDGTLIDSLDLHIEAFQWILNKLGKSVPKDRLDPLMGRTPQDIINEFFDDMSREELLSAASEKEDHLSKIVENVYVYPGIEEFLQKLQSIGVKSIVISSTHKRLVKILLEKAGLFQYMTDTVSGDEVKNGKPDPEPFLQGTEKAGVPKSKVIAIGDSIHDYQSASSAGVHFIGILTGKTERSTFENYGLDLMINSISEISLEQIG